MLKKRLQEYFKFLKSLINTNFRLLWGMWKLTRLPQPAITIFGSARAQPDSLICKKARQIAKLLAGAEFSIITGGGSGIMNAANEGAIEHLKEKHPEAYLKNTEINSAGIGLVHLNNEPKNPYVQDYIEMSHFFDRKWLMVRYSVGFVFFPGGFGTLDELFELTTLIQCNRMSKVPVILIDKSYWEPLLKWFKEYLLKEKFIDDFDFSIFTILDDIEEAAGIITGECRECKMSAFKKESEFKKDTNLRE